MITYKRVWTALVWLVLISGGTLNAAESDDFQRVATRTTTPVEVTLDSTILAQPDAPPRMVLGGVELELGIRLWNRWSINGLGRLPVDLLAPLGETYTARRTGDATFGVATAYSFGPSHLRHRVSASMETPRSYNTTYSVAVIRDPVVQGVGVSVDVNEPEPGAFTATVGIPLSVALVVNDITSVHVELTPSAVHVLTEPHGTLSAVIATRWAWDKVHVGSAALFGRQGAPGGMALSGGIKWEKDK